MSREIMQQALDALRISAPLGHAMEDYEYRHKVIKDIEAELAKPEQAEKVKYFDGRTLVRLRQAAWKKVRQEYKGDPECCFAMGFDAGIDAVAPRVEPAVSQSGGGFESLPASPQAERQEPEHWSDCAVYNEPAYPKGECNCGGYTPEQEPVTWKKLTQLAQSIVEEKYLFKRFIDGTPLANDIACWMADFALVYTAPPRKEWVGLTDFEIDKCDRNSIAGADSLFGRRFYKAMEAKLKEKNGDSTN